MSKSFLIVGVLAGATWLSPSLVATAAIPASSTDVFSIEYNADALTQSKAGEAFDRQLKRAARKYCAVDDAPGLRQASRRCERIIIARVKTELAKRRTETRYG